MEKSIEIVKSLLIPELEKDDDFKSITINDFFWETFLQSFLKFENDAKPSYELIYGMRLNDPERIFKKFPNIYSNLIKELAELYILGFKDKFIDYLAQNNNLEFQKEIAFLKTMQNVIKKVERKRIKTELPSYYERLTFEFSENTMEAVAKKKGREDLKEQFKKWDAEIQKEKIDTVFYSLEPEKKANAKPTVISLSWMKYAVAACIVFGLGIWFFKFNSPDIPTDDSNFVVKENDTINKSNPEIKIKAIEAVAYSIKTNKNSIQYPSDFGFTTTDDSKSILVLIKDGSKSIQILEKKLSKSNIDSVRKQLDLLKYQMGKYEFDGKELIIYSSNTNLKTTILSIDDKAFYLKKNNVYYYLFFTKLPLEFKEVKDNQLIEQLEKISFENE